MVSPVSDSEAVRSALRTQAQRLHQQEEQLSILRNELMATANRQENQVIGVSDQIAQLATQFQRLSTRESPAGSGTGSGSVAASTGSRAASSSFPHLARPERFSGDSGDCRAFLTQCELHFELQAAAYPSDRAKVAFIISHLSGRAESWAAAEWSQKSVVCDSYSCFTKTFTWIFQHVTPGREAARALVGLRQARRRVSNYAIEFRILAAESGWNSFVLSDTFLCAPTRGQNLHQTRSLQRLPSSQDQKW
uniref:DUF4939 domain-containing protein n=1 Tax=Sander lucioperca TaxID=283035 RepID=A0A8C9Z2Z8_SANLU